MTNEDLNIALYEKLYAEQKKHREWVLSLPPEEILNHAYECLVREDIVLTIVLCTSKEKLYYLIVA